MCRCLEVIRQRDFAVQLNSRFNQPQLTIIQTFKTIITPVDLVLTLDDLVLTLDDLVLTLDHLVLKQEDLVLTLSGSSGIKTRSSGVIYSLKSLDI